jgi:hypothetical protein
MTGRDYSAIALLVGFALILTTRPSWAAQNGPRGRPWPMHVIDASSRGADGVRLADVNGDRLMDVATGWEEGGITRVYLHPGHRAAGKPWPAVTVGKAPDVEDAVLVDLDADGRLDVVSSCEGRTRTMFVHWAPKDRQAYLDPTAWKTQPLPASQDLMMWMFCLAAQVDGRRGVDLLAGGKGDGAQLGWFEAPDNPRKLDQWKWHPISPAGWIMSLRFMDVDGDGDRDVVTTDRKGPLRGCRWLENPGPGPAQLRPWRNHFIGGRQDEVMFMTVADLDTDGNADLLAATRPQPLLFFRRQPGTPPSWTTFSIAMPENVGSGKGIAVGDINRDGRPDIIFSCENAGGDRSGVMWLSYRESPTEKVWTPHEISGPAGIKFDRIELLDLDGDGDLDVLACEESHPVAGQRRGLGVFWYENPAAGQRSDTHEPTSSAGWFAGRVRRVLGHVGAGCERVR